MKPALEIPTIHNTISLAVARIVELEDQIKNSIDLNDMYKVLVENMDATITELRGTINSQADTINMNELEDEWGNYHEDELLEMYFDASPEEPKLDTPDDVDTRNQIDQYASEQYGNWVLMKSQYYNKHFTNDKPEDKRGAYELDGEVVEDAEMGS